jgi:hypothetical protein
VLTT